MMKKAILLVYLALGLYGAVASWRIPPLRGLRDALARNSVIPFQDYSCIKELAGDKGRMDFLGPGSTGGAGQERFDFVAAQYVLAPALLHSGYSGQDLVVARYTEEEELNQALREYRLEIVQSCGRGVYLLREGSSP